MSPAKRAGLALLLASASASAFAIVVRSRTGAEERALVRRLAAVVDADRGNTDLERFASLSEAAAAMSHDLPEFLTLVSAVVLGSSWPLAGLPAGLLSRSLWVASRRRRLPSCKWADATVGRFGSSGFAVGDGSNQVQHFWFYVAAALAVGAPVAEIGARYHEWNPPSFLRWLLLAGGGSGTAGDLSLGRQALKLAALLRAGAVSPSDVGPWVREHLGPSAAAIG